MKNDVLFAGSFTIFLSIWAYFIFILYPTASRTDFSKRILTQKNEISEETSLIQRKPVTTPHFSLPPKLKIPSFEIKKQLCIIQADTRISPSKLPLALRVNQHYCETTKLCRYLFTESKRNIPAIWIKSHVVYDLMMENSTCTSFAYLDSDAVIIDLVPILEAWEEEKTFLTCCPGGVNSGVWFVRHNNIGKEILSQWCGKLDLSVFTYIEGSNKWVTDHNWGDGAASNQANLEALFKENEWLAEHVQYVGDDMLIGQKNKEDCNWGNIRHFKSGPNKKRQDKQARNMDKFLNSCFGDLRNGEGNDFLWHRDYEARGERRRRKKKHSKMKRLEQKYIPKKSLFKKGGKWG